MDQRNITRIMLEGALNGIGFVIGSAIVGWIFVHVSSLLALLIIGIVLSLIFRDRWTLRARPEQVNVEEFTRALRSAAVERASQARGPASGGARTWPQGAGPQSSYQPDNTKAATDR
jgi:hypothetical protein